MLKEISVHELKKVLEEDGLKSTILVDVRTKPEHRATRIKGAVNIPLDELMEHKEELEKFDTVFVHCRSGGRSAKGCEMLSGINAHVINVGGGILEWQAEGFAVDKSEGFHLPLIQQIHLIAGLLNLLGAILALLVHPNWIFLCVWIGLGMSLAGVTGWCGMTKILMRMPWNK